MNRRLALPFDLSPAAAATGHSHQQLDGCQAPSSLLQKDFTQQKIKLLNKRKSRKKCKNFRRSTASEQQKGKKHERVVTVGEVSCGLSPHNLFLRQRCRKVLAA